MSTALRDETVERTEVRVATNVLPRISQNLKRVCKGCGHRHTYDVGRIFFQGLIETDPRKPFLGGLR